MIYEDIIKTEINNRKGKDTSKNTYITSLIKILKKYENVYKDIANIDTFNYYDKIIEILPSKITTRKNYIIAILVLTRNNPKYKNVYKKYLEYSQSIKKEHLKYVKNHNKDCKISWNELKNVKKSLWATLEKEDIKNAKQLSYNQRYKLQDYLIVSLYILLKPKRTEYSNVKIINEDKYKELSKEEIKKNNWLVITDHNTKYFVFTNKNKETIYEFFGNEINEIINLYLKHHKNRKWLLYDKRDNKMTANNLVKQLQRIFRPLNMNVSVSLIRYLYNNMINDIKEKTIISC